MSEVKRISRQLERVVGLGDGGLTQPVEEASYLERMRGDPGEVLTQDDKGPART